MTPIKYEELDKKLQKRIDIKETNWVHTIATAVLCSLLFPSLIVLGKWYFIERPKERVQLVYDINQSKQYLEVEKKYLTDVEIENTGKKDTGNIPVVFTIEFRSNIEYLDWPTSLDSTCIIENTGGLNSNKFIVKFKNFGQGAKCGIRFKTEKDLIRLPILSHNQIFFTWRVMNILNKDL